MNRRRSFRPRRRMLSRHGFSALGLCISASLHAQAPAPTQSEWGGVGLLQTPSARMADAGEFSFTASHTSPYSRYNFSMQPFSWLEGSFRYISIAGVRYGPPELSGDQHYKDKSIDLKLRLWRESHWLPEIAAGARDLGGTGLFSSEYLVANKRFGPIDASLGLATGYLGNRGDFGNPLGALDDRFKVRPGAPRGNTGNFSGRSMFRGRIGLFGGIAWQTPWEPLLLKLEYDGNDYRHEPRDIQLHQRTPWNIGAVYSAGRNVQFSLGWERGNELMAALTLHTNLAHPQATAKVLDPAPEPLIARDGAVGEGAATAASYRDTAGRAQAGREPGSQAAAGTDWEAVARRLRDNAGIDVEKISLRGPELVITGEQNRYFYPAQGLGRGARILDNVAGPDIQWFTVVNTRLGMPVAEASVHRDAFADYVEHRSDLRQLSRNVELEAPSQQQRDLLYRAPLQHYRGGLSLGYKQTIGGPDAFILYQLSANYSASYFFTRTMWLSGTISAGLLDNYDQFRYDAPSRLPRVRTYLRQYLTTSDVTVPNLQLTAVKQLSRDVYGMAYAGLLESMYGGAGGEVLYRPFGEPWAVGVNANWVRQRDFDQHGGFRDYDVATGHATLYYQFGQRQRVLASVSAGRYLAGDWGATFGLARLFDNGVTMGAYATKTNVSSAEFGEGSFDKGIFFSLPFDLFMPRSSRSRATFVWSPLTRDGGAMLARRYSLYALTGERDRDFFFGNLDKIGE